MKDLPLLPGEVDKAVDVYLYVLINIGVLIYLPSEDTEPVGRIGVAVRDGGVIGFEDEGEVRELIAEAVRAGGRGGHERVIADAGALELVHGGEQQRLKLRAALGGGIDAQARTDALQRERHAQQPPALIKPRLGSAAVLCGGLARKAGEAQHFRIERERVPADAAELTLGLVAVLLGDDHQSAAMRRRHIALYFVYDGRRLAGAGLAGHQSEQMSVLLFTVFVMDKQMYENYSCDILSKSAAAYKPDAKNRLKFEFFIDKFKEMCYRT